MFQILLFTTMFCTIFPSSLAFDDAGSFIHDFLHCWLDFSR
jgi:hypothetical protein